MSRTGLGGRHYNEIMLAITHRSLTSVACALHGRAVRGSAAWGQRLQIQDYEHAELMVEESRLKAQGLGLQVSKDLAKQVDRIHWDAMSRISRTLNHKFPGLPAF